MSDSNRDTQFQGFASALFDDLNWNDINIDFDFAGWEDRWKLKIAQRAYDLVQHTIDHSTDKMGIEPLAFIEDIPDLTELPEVTNE